MRIMYLLPVLAIICIGCSGLSHLNQFTTFQENHCLNGKLDKSPCVWVVRGTSMTSTANYANIYGSEGNTISSRSALDSIAKGNHTSLSYQSYGFISSRIGEKFVNKKERTYITRRFKKAKRGLLETQLIRTSPAALDPKRFKIKVSKDQSIPKNKLLKWNNRRKAKRVDFSLQNIRKMSNGLWLNHGLLKVRGYKKEPVIYVQFEDNHQNKTLVFKIGK
ncbi:MAG: hypothetical protein ABJF04_01895 [Reichenbachiella sp.]|uniref:hypothetical protein n=1 Tax=Reichenbachiella sp. TaxID=2184521 RepID=UPI0032673697